MLSVYDSGFGIVIAALYPIPCSNGLVLTFAVSGFPTWACIVVITVITIIYTSIVSHC